MDDCINDLVNMGFSQQQANQAAEKNGTDVPKCLDWLVEQDSWTTVPSTVTPPTTSLTETDDNEASIDAQASTAKQAVDLPKATKKKKKKKEKRKTSETIDADPTPKQTVPETVTGGPQEKASGEWVVVGNAASNSAARADNAKPTPEPIPEPTTKPTSKRSPDSKSHSHSTSRPPSLLHPASPAEPDPEQTSATNVPSPKPPPPPKVTFAKLLPGGTKRRQRTQSEPSQHVSFNLDVNDVLLYTPNHTPNHSPQLKKKNTLTKKEKKEKHRLLTKVKRSVSRRFDGPGWSIQDHLKNRRRRTSSCSALPASSAQDQNEQENPANPDALTSTAASDQVSKPMCCSWLPIVLATVAAGLGAAVAAGVQVPDLIRREIL